MKEQLTSGLQSLLNFDRPIWEISKFLQPYWLSEIDEDLVILNRSHIITVLQRYLKNDITKNDVYQWESMIIGRDNIAREPGYADFLGDMLEEIDDTFEPDYQTTPQDVIELIRKIEEKQYDPEDAY